MCMCCWICVWVCLIYKSMYMFVCVLMFVYTVYVCACVLVWCACVCVCVLIWECILRPPHVLGRATGFIWLTCRAPSAPWALSRSALWVHSKEEELVVNAFMIIDSDIRHTIINSSVTFYDVCIFRMQWCYEHKKNTEQLTTSIAVPVVWGETIQKNSSQ